jgi:hypothetical protein
MYGFPTMFDKDVPFGVATIVRGPLSTTVALSLPQGSSRDERLASIALTILVTRTFPPCSE